jgi:hypothetical protein
MRGALRRDGRLLGGNGDGQLGDGTDRMSDIPVEVQGLTDATEVAAGYQHTCALLSSGQVDSRSRWKCRI